MLKNEVINTKAVKFNLWLAILSMIMMFAGWTSGYLVRKAQGNWLEFDMPQWMTYSTLVILISSITLFFAQYYAKKIKLDLQRVWLWATLVLGLVFIGTQFLAFREMAQKGIFLDTNPSSSFLMVIAFFHALHILAGVFALIYAFAGTNGKISQSRNVFRMECVSIFWHFVDILWIYLYLFLLLER